MSELDFVPQIPYGTRDFLPREAFLKRTVEASVADLFARWGYDEVVTPTFEYWSTLQIGLGSGMGDNIFKFLDNQNRILALRPDMTTPIARLASTRLKETASPLRLFYLTNVFRYEQAQSGRQCEFYQAGVELMGEAGPAADGEVIALAIEALLASGLENFQIGLGQVNFIHGVMDSCQMGEAQRRQMKNLMFSRDLVGLEKALGETDICPTMKEMLQRIPLLNGREEMLNQVYEKVTNDVSRQALDDLRAIYRFLELYGLEKYVTFDLGIIRDFGYYTGMVFEAYTPGMGFPICGGGRYDTMLSGFGIDCPATGFAMGIERVLLAMERQGLVSDMSCRDVYVAWGDNSMHQAIVKAGELRKQGRKVELGLTAQTRAEAESVQKEKRFRDLIYVMED